MLGWRVLYLWTVWIYSETAWAQGECLDLRGRVIAHGLHYVPGPDTCTLCVCENTQPKACKAVLCSPPQDCRSFRVGNTCCEFICLDDVVKPATEGADGNVRLAAGGASAVVLLTVVLVVYRVRKQKRRRQPRTDDQRSLTSIGYISGSMGYMGGTCETALAAWKPGGHYLPRGEAPPPYDEAVAQCRQESLRASEQPYHRSYPAAVEAMARPDEPPQCQGHSYANIQRPVHQLANPQGCYNAPLLQQVHPQEARDPASLSHHPLAPNMVGFPSAFRLTGSLGAISNRGLLSVLHREPDERPHNGFYAHTSLHRTIPRISTAMEAAALDAPLGFGRGERGLHAEIRRSFHKPSDARHDTGRSMPRNLNIVSATEATAHFHPPPPAPHAPHAPHTPHTPHTRHEPPPPPIDTSNIRVSASGVSNGGTSANMNTSASMLGVRRDEPDGSEGVKPAKPLKAAPSPHQTLPLTVDQPSCVCSYAGGEGDDYRAECENCQAASNSRWAVEEEWAGEEEDGTQTLQRRAPPPPPPPATHTLPQPVKQTRTIVGPPSNWESWFKTMPDSDTESEEE